MTVPLEHLPLVQHLAKRPGMFTANSSLAEVLAFFDGYELGRRYLQAELETGIAMDRKPTPEDTLTWLAAQCGYDKERTFVQDRHERLLKRFGSPEAVLAAVDAYATTLKTS